MNEIDKNLMEDLRKEAKDNNVLESIVASVSRSTLSEASQNSKPLK